MNRHIDKLIISATVLLLGLSLIMVYSTTALRTPEAQGHNTAFAIRHLGSIVIGLVGMFSLSYISPLNMRRFARPLMIIGLVLLVMVLIPGIGYEAGGAKRWISLPGTRFQPSEFFKIIIVLYFADYISRHESQMNRFSRGIVVPVILLGLISVLLLLEPDFGSTAVISGVVFCMLMTSARVGHLLLLACGGLASLLAVSLAASYRLQRWQTFLDPFKDPKNAGYQLIQSLIAVGSGGLFGVGLGSSTQKLYYLPAAHTDFIFAVIAEELGLLGAIFCLLVYLLLGYRGFVLVKKNVEDPFMLNLALGCTLLICIPAVLNIGVVLGLLPTKGLVLPLVSYGGTAMVANLLVIGVLLSVSRYSD